jgi:hypothetical protein
MKPSHIAAFAIWAVLATPLGAQDFGAGVAAYEAGDFATALENWQPLAEQGNANAQFVLGFMYDTGRGVLQDDAEAARWYRMAAEQGDAIAQINLGFIYETGQGVLQDDAEAVRWYRLAAEQGDARGQYNLGVMYATGQGVPQDYAEAVRWYRLAAEQGYAIAHYNLGGMYFNGQGVRATGLRGGGALVSDVRRAGQCHRAVQPWGHLFQRTGRAAGHGSGAHVAQYSERKRERRSPSSPCLGRREHDARANR